jgi:hypothetical protein
MSEESYKIRQRNKRIFAWGTIIVLIIGIISGGYTIIPNSISHPEYVPTISNGLVASMSILMGLAFFSMSHFLSAIQDRTEKWRYLLLSMIYLIILFVILFLGILFGYSSILNEAYVNAIYIFIIAFLLICGVLFDMWTISGDFTFK